MRLSPGTRLGPYEILDPIGSGGMGEVYRAHDSRLGRDVAIKVLPGDLASNRDRMRRFANEARSISALNHPNIVTVHEIDEVDSISFIVMELVQGSTLREMLKGAPFSVKKTLQLAAQIAEGMAKAHDSGIVHRDLKPENVMVTPDGLVKILDFGLVKLVEAAAGLGSAGPAESTAATRPGAMLGTVGYMAPEQVRGETATAAADQFSFGCMLYEMLTRERAFGRRSPAETLSAILRDEPTPLGDLNPQVPAPLRWIVDRCLAKAPRDRYLSTGDLARDLQNLKEHSGEAGLQSFPAGLATPPRRWLVAAARTGALALAAATVGFLVAAWLRRPLEPEIRRLTFREGSIGRALFAAGSNAILYTAAWDGGPTRTYMTLPEFSGSDRSLDAEPQLPMSYSADGAQVLVLLGVTGPRINAQGALAWWPALGGKPRRLMERAGWADWAKKGNFLVVVRDLGAERVLEVHDAGGAQPRTLFSTRGGIVFVRISPDEKDVAFIHHPSFYDDAGEVRVSGVDGSGSRALTGRFERCTGLDWNHRTEELWFTASRTPYDSVLMAVAPTGRPRPLHVLPDFFALQSVAPAGDRCLLIWRESRLRLIVRAAGGAPRDFSWMGWTLVKDVSPDEQSVLFYDGGTTEKASGVWIRSLDGGDAVRLGDGEPGGFSPDGRFVVATTRPLTGPSQLVLIPVAAGNPRQLTSSDADHSQPSFAGPDLLLFVRSRGGDREVWTMKTDGGGARPLGAANCGVPSADPSATRFVCAGGEDNRAVFLYPMERGPGQKLIELPPGAAFLYARWSASGDRVMAVTTDRRLFTLDAAKGKVLSEETLPLPGSAGFGPVLSAAVSADGSVQAYTALRSSSGLYLMGGLR
jgi:eukaryotic-like serine/threonine-protein kinase